MALAAVTLVALCGILALASGSLQLIPPPALVMAALGVFCLVQSIPLPIRWLETLSPSAQPVWAGALSPFKERSAFGALSLDPGASTLEAAKWMAYAVTFSIAAMFGKRRGARLGIAVVFASALLVALATVGHGLAGATRVFGIYEPQLGTAPEHVGPMLNTNALAGYLVLGGLCGVGFALSAKDPLVRWLWAVGVAAILGVSVLSGSRGGLGAMVLGLLADSVFFYASHRKRQTLRNFRWTDWAALSVAPVAACAFAGLGARDAWFELTQRDLTKLKMGAWVLPLVKDFPVFGIGRGAFESAFPFYKPTADNLVYANPENIVAQWISEWGLPVGVLALSSLVWMLRPSRVAFGRHPLASSALIGVLVLVLQNLVDFSLELFAPMAAAVLVLGCCWGQGTSSNGGVRRTTSQSRLVVATLVVFSVLCVGLGWCRATRPVALERRTLLREYQALHDRDQAEISQMWTDLRSAMLRHPADPYFPRLGAVLALRLGSVEPLPWIARSLERGPVESRTHWLLAQALQRYGYLQQALLEARLSAEYDPALSTVVGSATARWSANLDDLERTAPTGRAGTEFRLAAARGLAESNATDVRTSLLRNAVRNDPSFAAARLALGEQLLANIGTDRCSSANSSACVEAVLRQADELDRLSPDAADGSEMRARLYALTDQPELADRALSARCPSLAQSARLKCWQALLATALAHPGHREMVARIAGRLVETACSLQDSCEMALLQAGDASGKLGNWPEALAYFQRAVRIDPNVPSLLREADAASAMGAVGVAMRALETAAAHAGTDAELRKRIEGERKRLLGNPQQIGLPADQ